MSGTTDGFAHWWAQGERLLEAGRRVWSHRLTQRAVSSLTLGAPAVFCALWGGWAFAIWVTLFAAIAAFEWDSIAFRERPLPALALHLGGLAAVLVLCLSGHSALVFLAIAATAVAGLPLARFEGIEARWLVIGAVYLLLPVAALLWLRTFAVEPAAVVLWLFAVVWATDSAAYLVGRFVGGPKLAPRLSPRKTWAGFAGGVAGAVLTGFAGGYLIDGRGIWALALLAGLLAILGQLGDLTESAFKRQFGVKDSGRLIPGQGGVLDRVDGLIFAAVALAGLALIRGGDVLFLGMRS